MSNLAGSKEVYMSVKIDFLTTPKRPKKRRQSK
jgi:hypothetical protein